MLMTTRTASKGRGVRKQGSLERPSCLMRRGSYDEDDESTGESDYDEDEEDDELNEEEMPPHPPPPAPAQRAPPAPAKGQNQLSSTCSPIPKTRRERRQRRQPLKQLCYILTSTHGALSSMALWKPPLPGTRALLSQAMCGPLPAAELREPVWPHLMVCRETMPALWEAK